MYYCKIVDSVHIIPLWHRLPIAPSNPRLPPGLGVCAKWNEGFATFQKVSPALKPLCLSNGVFDFRAVWTRRTSAGEGTTELRGKQQELEIEDWLKALGGRRRQALTDQLQVGSPLTSTLTIWQPSKFVIGAYNNTFLNDPNNAKNMTMAYYHKIPFYVVPTFIQKYMMIAEMQKINFSWQDRNKSIKHPMAPSSFCPAWSSQWCHPLGRKVEIGPVVKGCNEMWWDLGWKCGTGTQHKR